MTNRYGAGLILLLTLGWLPSVAAGAAAQTVENAPTNCCAEIYWAGWELGRLRSIAAESTSAYRQDAGLHLERLGTTLQAANAACCRFCEAWADWPRIQNGIRATADALAGSPDGESVEARRAFREWVESRPAELIAGLSRCDLEEGTPCKWLGVVECARAYFRLGVELGYAMHAPGSASEGARQEALRSLDAAAGLLASLQAGDGAPGTAGSKLRCDYLWDLEDGVERRLSEVVGRPDAFTDAELTTAAAEANRWVLDLLVHGRPALGIPPCPIGDESVHAECERAKPVGR